MSTALPHSATDQLRPGLRAELRRSYETRDVQIHALGCGRGLRSSAPADLACLTKSPLAILPTFVLTLGNGADLFTANGLDWASLVVLSQDFDLSGPLPQSGTVEATDEVISLVAKPTSKATVATVATEVRMDGKTIAQISTRWLLRGVLIANDGSISGLRCPVTTQRRKAGLEAEIAASRLPATETYVPTSPQAALIFRLLGGHSPLHSDPTAAQDAGFNGPILHGQSIVGHIMAALAETHANFDLSRILGMGCDFVGPLYPGETLRVESRETEDGILFEAACDGRAARIVRSGLLRLL